MMKVIQLPIDDRLLSSLTDISKQQNKSRAEFIRDACQHYIQELEHQQLELAYQKGYEQIPEEPGMGEAQLAISAQVLSRESW